MRLTLGVYPAECPLGTLFGVSAMGTKLRFYLLTKSEEFLPQVIPKHPTQINDTAPVERWNGDILEASGEQRLLEVVDAIKTACAAL